MSSKSAKGSLTDQSKAPAAIGEPSIAYLRFGQTGKRSETLTADELVIQYNLLMLEMTHLAMALIHCFDFEAGDTDGILAHAKALDVRGSKALDQAIAWCSQVQEFKGHDETNKDYHWDIKGDEIGDKWRQLDGAIKWARSKVQDLSDESGKSGSHDTSLSPSDRHADPGSRRIPSELSPLPHGVRELGDTDINNLLTGLGPELDDIDSELQSLDLSGDARFGNIASDSGRRQGNAAIFLPPRQEELVMGWTRSNVDSQLAAMREFENTLPKHEGSWSNSGSRAGSSVDSDATEKGHGQHKHDEVEDTDGDNDNSEDEE